MLIEFTQIFEIADRVELLNIFFGRDYYMAKNKLSKLF